MGAVGGHVVPAPRRRLRTAAALTLLIVVPLVPGVISTGSALRLVGIPVESLVILLLLAVVPWRPGRVALAAAFGTFVCVAVVLAAVDRGYDAALGTRFVPLDWPQLGDAYGVLAAAIGPLPASALVSAALAVLVAAACALAWAALRIDAVGAGHSHRRHRALAAVTGVWIVFAAAAIPLGATVPVAAAASTGSVGAAVSRTVTALHDREAVARAIADDRYADAAPGGLVRALRGKDVVIAFIESYGRVALEGGGFSSGVNDTLRRGESLLAAEGYVAESAWLTSPTSGGVSWLAHATLQSGVWIDSQTAYSEVMRSDRLTLSAAFAEAGWRTVGVVPSNTQPWPVGQDFYRFDEIWDATDLGYRGPPFGYARVPDQYVWKHFADHELAGSAQPVMAEVDLVSSHTPWAPLPELVPWGQIGDGSLYHAQRSRSASAGEVWEDAETVQRHYGRSIEYALGSMLAFLENVDDRDLVLIALGDHQPAPIVTGEGAGRDVPVSIIAKDPAVLEAIAGWEWTPGLRPGTTSPVWGMDAFRDRLFSAFRE